MLGGLDTTEEFWDWSHVQQAPVGDCIEPVWLKQKARVAGEKALRRISRSLQRRGLRVGTSNWPMLLQSGQRGEGFPVAADAANHWADVPVHQNLSDVAIDTIVNSMSRLP